MRHIEVEVIATSHRYADKYSDIEGRVNRDSAIALVLSLISSGLSYLFHQDPSLAVTTAIGTSSLVGLLRWRYLHVTDKSLSELWRHAVLDSLHRGDNRGSGSPAHPLPPTPPTYPGSLSPNPVPAMPPPGNLAAEVKEVVRV